jgi:uncharacterized delta-60 repeat protein
MNTLTLFFRRPAWLALGLALVFAEVVRAGLGDLDPDFRLPGRIIHGAGKVGGTAVSYDDLLGMAVQGDGRIVLASGNVLLRLLPDGALDPSFGTAGRVIHPGGRRGVCVALQSDGKIVVGGRLPVSQSTGDFSLLRYLADGTLDPAFGAGGTAEASFGTLSGERCNALAIQADGRIVAAGGADGGNIDFAVARFLPSGVLDSTFDGDGKVSVPVTPNGVDIAYGVAVRADGKIVVSGEVRIGYASGGAQFLVFGWDLGDAVLSASGAVEATGFYQRSYTFGYESVGRMALRPDGSRVLIGGATGGSLNNPGPNGFFIVGASSTPIFNTFQSAGAQGRCIAMGTDGRYLVAGSVNAAGSTHFAIARYEADDTLDTTFSLDGMASFAVSGDFEYADAVARLSDGRILVAGRIYSGGIALLRLQPDGELDPTFGAPGGWQIAPVLETHRAEARAVALQPDGRIVTATTYGPTASAQLSARVSRRLPDGTRDFETTLVFQPAASYPTCHANAVALQADGKMVVAGSAGSGSMSDIAVARVNTAGILDTSWSGDGLLTSDFSSEDAAHGVAVQSDGKIVVVGTAGMTGARNFLVVRYLADGSLDPAFGTTGVGHTLTSFGRSDDIARAVAFQPDRKIVVAGTVLGPGDYDFGVARYLADGSLDPSFGGGQGSVLTDLSLDDYAHGLALQPDGKIVVCGTDGNAMVVRYLPDGTLDPAFGTGGIAGAIITVGPDVARSVVVQSNGRIVLAGSGDGDFVLARFNPDGTPDASFSGDGEVRTDFLGDADSALGLALDANGDLIAAGFAGNGNGSDLAFARYEATDPDISVLTAGAAELVDGTAAIGLPAALVGGSSLRDFTVRNIGGDQLAGLVVTFEGGAASDFSVSQAPVSPVDGTEGSTAFTVRFQPAVAGEKSTLMKIASNDADEAPFRVQLSAPALTPTGDYDQDGVDNATEVQLAPLGFDPLVDSSSLRTLLQENGPGVGLYREQDVQTLALGAPLLSRHAVTGNFHLILSVEKSPDLGLPGSWTPLLGFDPTYDPQTGRIDLEFAPPPGSDAHFYRILAR